MKFNKQKYEPIAIIKKDNPTTRKLTRSTYNLGSRLTKKKMTELGAKNAKEAYTLLFQMYNSDVEE